MLAYGLKECNILVSASSKSDEQSTSMLGSHFPLFRTSCLDRDGGQSEF